MRAAVPKAASGDLDYTFLISVIDQRGVPRVQYAGVCFNPEEFQADLLTLMKEQ
jgi:protein SCO1/2